MDGEVGDVEERRGERLGIREDGGRDVLGTGHRRRRENCLHTIAPRLGAAFKGRSGDSVVA